MESTPTTVSVLQSGLVSTAQMMWMSVGCSQTLARTVAHAATWLAATSACASMVGAGPTAQRTSTTVRQPHAVQAPLALTALLLLSASVPTERQVCSATEMMPVSVTPAERVPTVTPTPSRGCLTVTVHRDTLAAPATLTETNASSVPTLVSMVVSV